MRLDHLLSREKGEAGMRRLIPGRYSAEAEGERNPVEETGRITVCSSKICIAFRDHIYGGLAQLGERLPCKQEVSGSNPLISTFYGLIAQSVRAPA